MCKIGTPESLVELRSCLLFEQRGWRHFDETPQARAVDYIRALVEAIQVYASEGADSSEG